MEVSARHPLHHHQKWRKNVSIIVPTKAERPRVDNLGDEVMTIASGTSKFEPLAPCRRRRQICGCEPLLAGAAFVISGVRYVRFFSRLFC
jgi:hypothetical protein